MQQHICQDFSFEKEYVRGRNNPAVKDISVRNCFSKRCEDNDVFFYDAMCACLPNLSLERSTTIQSIFNSLVALRDIGHIVSTFMPSTIPFDNIEEQCAKCAKNFFTQISELIKFHSTFFLFEDQTKFFDSLKTMENLDYSIIKSWEELIDIRKGILITIGIDIKINTSVGLFGMKKTK